MKSYFFSAVLIYCVFLPSSQGNTSINFEMPRYTTGAIVGQDGWAGDSNILISDAGAYEGAQCLSFPASSSWLNVVRHLDSSCATGIVTVDIAIYYTTDKSGYVDILDSSNNPIVGFGIFKGNFTGGNWGTHWAFDYGPAGHVGTAVPGGNPRWIEMQAILNLDSSTAELKWREAGGVFTTLITGYSLPSGVTISKIRLGGLQLATRFDKLTVTLSATTPCQDLTSNGHRFIGDLNRDCHVDFKDYAILMENWLKCNDPTNLECEIKGIGQQYRIFATKVYPGHGRLSLADFEGLSHAGFTAVVDTWKEDVPAFMQGSGASGLDGMTWQHGTVDADDASGEAHTVTSEGKATRYTVPYSARAWAIITQQVVDQAVLSITYQNFKAALLDFEIYDENKTNGFAESYDDTTFAAYLAYKNLPNPSPYPSAGQRNSLLSSQGYLNDYISWQYNKVAIEVAKLRQAVDTINKEFQIGVYGWGPLIEAVKQNVASSSAPVLDLSASTYGRTLYPYEANIPDRLGLKASLIINAQLAKEARKKNYPVILLGGHYPQAPGPENGTSSLQYKFTVRQSFNSAAYADGYWIWTDWSAPSGLDKQTWLNDMMYYWHEANTALDKWDFTWSSRQPDQIIDTEATNPLKIITRNVAGVVTVWAPLTGAKININESPTSVWSKNAFGDVDGIAGAEHVTLTDGWIEIRDDSDILLLKFFVGEDQVEMQLISAQIAL